MRISDSIKCVWLTIINSMPFSWLNFPDDVAIVFQATRSMCLLSIFTFLTLQSTFDGYPCEVYYVRSFNCIILLKLATFNPLSLSGSLSTLKLNTSFTVISRQKNYLSCRWLFVMGNRYAVGIRFSRTN